MEFHAKEQLPGLLDWMQQQIVFLEILSEIRSHR